MCIPRTLSNHTQGGGIVVLIREKYKEYITVDKILYDSVVWLRLDKVMFEHSKDVFMAGVYIPPSRSNYYAQYNCDLFFEIETSIAEYSNLGEVILIGDFNSRTRNDDDFIENDDLVKNLQQNVRNFFNYENDVSMDKRINPDNVRNEYGTRLLNLCKATGLRILNGRDPDKFSNDFTFNGTNGMSTIDYLIANPVLFPHIKTFIVCNFTEYSDHAPLHVELRVRVSRDAPITDESTGVSRPTYKWNEQYKEQCLVAIRENIDKIKQVATIDGEITQEAINSSVYKFTHELLQILSPFTTRSRGASRDSATRSPDESIPRARVRQDNKPWFDRQLRALRGEYLAALNNFNRNKCDETHDLLIRRKREYKRSEAACKRQYRKVEGDMMEHLRKTNPRYFYKKFSSTKSNVSNVSLDEFFNHFKEVATNLDPPYNDHVEENDDRNTVFEELDRSISTDEIKCAIKRLKREKAHGLDGLLNEYFIEAGDILLQALHTIFNNVFNSGCFPEEWSKAVMVPVFKKGDKNDPNNYRGISLLSCMAKLFTSVLNKRLVDWSESNDIITDAQFGFRPGTSTVDAIFALHAIITKSLNDSKRLYCCFVDYKKAFDSVDRCKLWYKLSKLGVRGRLLSILKAMYKKVKTCVSSKGRCSDFFANNMGLAQGEILSPIMFSMYVNDFENEFIANGIKPYDFGELSLFLLMYADDLVLLAESANELQNMLNSLSIYANSWKLTVNTAKTKIVVFRNGGRLRNNEEWFFDRKKIEVVEQFTYLGIVFKWNNKFNVVQKQLSGQGRKSVFALYTKCKNMNLNCHTLIKLFDTYVTSILCYASEVWGSCKGIDIEKVHLEFCKRILCVKKSTCNVMIYFELGRFPIVHTRHYNLIKYWFKLLNTKNCVLKTAYDELMYMPKRNTVFNWVTFVKDKLFSLGLGEVWLNQNTVNSSDALPIIKQRIFDNARQELFEILENSTKCFLYRHLVDNLTLQQYLCKYIPKRNRIALTRLRLSAHALYIETGRYRNIVRNERICRICNSEDIEDEYHFLFICPFYQVLREKRIKLYYWKKPSVFKLIQLLSTTNVKELTMLSKYIYDATQLRNSMI